MAAVIAQIHFGVLDHVLEFARQNDNEVRHVKIF